MPRIEITEPQFNVPVVPLPSVGTAQADAIGAVGKTIGDVAGAWDKRLKEDGELAAMQKASQHRLDSYARTEADRRSGNINDGYTLQRQAETEQWTQEQLQGMDNHHEASAFQRLMLDAQGDEFYRSSAAESAVRTARNYETAETSMDNLERSIAMDASPENYAARTADADRVIKTFADQGEFAAVERLRVHRQQMAHTYFRRMIHDDPNAAIEDLSADSGPVTDLPGADVPVLLDQAEAKARQDLNESNAATDAVRKEWVVRAENQAHSSVAQMTLTGVPPTPEDWDTVMRGSSPQGYERFATDMKKAQRVWNATGDLRFIPESELERRRVNALPTVKPGPGYDEQQDIHVAVDQLVAAERKSRLADPGAAGIGANAAAQEAWARYFETAPAEQTAAQLQDAMDRTIAGEDMLEIDRGSQAPAPKWVTDRWAKQINNASPDDTVALLDRLAEHSGMRWPQLFRQMQSKLSPAMMVAPIMHDRVAMAQLVNGAKSDPKTLAGLADAPETGPGSIKNTALGNTTLTQLKQSLRKRQDGNALAQSVQESVEILAKVYRGRGGFATVQDAVDEAVKKIVDEPYAMIDGGGGGIPFRMPTTTRAEPARVQLGANYMRQWVVTQLGGKLTPSRAIEGVPAAVQQAQFRSAVATNAYWVTTDDEQGASLYVNDSPVLLDGHEIAYTFKDFENMGQYAIEPSDWEQGKLGKVPLQPAVIPQMMVLPTDPRAKPVAAQPAQPAGVTPKPPVVPAAEITVPPYHEPAIGAPKNITQPPRARRYKPPAQQRSDAAPNAAPPSFSPGVQTAPDDEPSSQQTRQRSPAEFR